NSCVSQIPYLLSKCFFILFTSSSFKPYSDILLYHSDKSCLYLTYLSIGCSPSVVNLINELAAANSSNVSGLILLIDDTPTGDDIWNASNTSPFNNISYIPFDVISNLSGWKYLLYVSRKLPCHSINPSSNNKSIHFLTLAKPDIDKKSSLSPPIASVSSASNCVTSKPFLVFIIALYFV